MIKVKVDNLYNLVVQEKEVEAISILNEARTWYNAIKVEGAKNVIVTFCGSGNEIHKIATGTVNKKLRAFSALVVQIFNRWNDEAMGLERQYMLTERISDILDMKKLTKGFSPENILEMSIKDLIENYLK